MAIFSKDKRTILLRRIRGFWEEYRRNKIGIAGLLLLGFFIFISFLGPAIAPYPSTRPPMVASDFAMPEWMAFLPEYADLPRTLDVSALDTQLVQNSSFIEISRENNIVLVYAGNALGDIGTVQLSADFSYSYKPPDDFKVSFQYVIENVSNSMCKFKLTITDTNGTEYELLTGSSMLNIKYGVASTTSASASLRMKLFGDIQHNPAKVIFAGKGNYTMKLTFTFQPLSADAKGVFYLNSGALTIYGKLHGVLGSDAYGHDVYSQILYGAYTSMLVGVLTAVLTTGLSVLIGTIAGYLGGLVDEVIMRIVDVILCIPLFVILLILTKNFRLTVIFVVIVISFFWWPGPARTIRSKILALKESKFVEGARAAGGGKFYIVRRHLLPNVLPLIMASLILFVPGGILMEAALSFLGFGDPTAITWGRMLSDARQTGAFASLAWWYVIPPGIAISLLCLSFVFIGHALDTVVNPRLRRRK